MAFVLGDLLVCLKQAVSAHILYFYSMDNILGLSSQFIKHLVFRDTKFQEGD